jgi:hypothetical protein
MALTLHRGSTIYLVNDANVAYRFQVSDVTASQTLQESKQVRKTIHEPNQVARTFVDERTPASLQFTINVDSSGTCEKVLLDWFGMPDVGGKASLNALATEAKKLEVYLDSGNTVYKLDNCVAENLEMSFERSSVLTWSVSAVASNLTADATLPSFSQVIAQDSSKFFNAPVVVDGISNLVGVTFQVTRSIEWLKNKSIHDIGTIYKVSTPILNSIALSGKITTNKTDNSTNYTPDTSVVIRYGNSFIVNLDSCNTTDRWSMEEIHKLIKDYKYLSGQAYIQF